MIRRWVCVLSLLLSSVSLGQGLAVDRKDIVVDQEQFKDVAGDLRCPTCTGLSILDSDAAFSIQIKNEVKAQLSAGKSKDDILKFFTERYGPWILRAPPTEGVHVWAWIIPFAGLVLGIAAIFWFVWRKKPAADVSLRDSPVNGGLSTEEAVRELRERLNQLRGDDHV